MDILENHPVQTDRNWQLAGPCCEDQCFGPTVAQPERIAAPAEK